MQFLWSSSELAAALGTEPEGALAADVSGVSIDTRTLQAGDLFVALKDKRDGHEFVPAAFKAGAAAALVDESYQRAATDGALLRVADTLKALEVLGRFARERLSSEARLIAVTGSAGKTGTKEMLRACLARLGATHASEKSYNNHWGLPLTLARMPRDTRFGVFEIGMNHPGEIRPLAKMVRAHAAVITTVEAVHLEHFSSIEAIADAKAEIFEGLVPGGAAIIKLDSPHAGRLMKGASMVGAKPVTFGFDADADVSGESLRLGDEGSEMIVRIGERRIPVHVAIPGRHIAENALAIAASLAMIGADLDRSLTALGDVRPPSGRGARSCLQIDGGEVLLIDESYNANPASMRAALATLASVPRHKFARRVAVLGDMLELGADAWALHAELKHAVDEAEVDLIFACGPYMKALYDALPAVKRGSYASTSSPLEAALASSLRRGDVVLVKASNGTRFGALVAALKSRFGNEGSAA